MNKPAVLYAVAGAIVLVLLVRWHFNGRKGYESFCLLDLVAENGKLSLAKFNEFGSFVICAIAVIICVLEKHVPEGMTALLTLFAGAFALRRLAGMGVHATANASVRREELRQGAAPADIELTDPRETDSGDGEQPPGRPVVKPKRKILS